MYARRLAKLTPSVVIRSFLQERVKINQYVSKYNRQDDPAEFLSLEVSCKYISYCLIHSLSYNHSISK